MADEQKQDLALPQQDAGVAFRAEMWMSNVVLGYWRHFVAVVVLGLVGTLIYGLYTNEMRSRQRDATSRIAEAWEGLPDDLRDPMSATEEQKAQIRTVADDLAKIGQESSGTARAEAWLRAAEVYRWLAEPDQQREAFHQAAQTARGVLLYSARSGEANLDLQEGKGDDAVAILKDLMDTQEGLLGEEAALDLGVAYEHLERPADALSVYTTFLAKWPESPRAELVQERMARLDSGA